MLVVLLCALLIPAADVLTVDDDGPAQFTTIQAAIDAAVDGDVITVQAGSYAQFALAKSLSIVGPATGARPAISGRSSVTGPARVTLAALDFARLSVQDDPLRIVIDECTVGYWTEIDAPEALSIRDCVQVLVQRAIVHGSPHLQAGTYASGAGLVAVGSGVQVVDSKLHGGEGESYPGGLGSPGGTGGVPLLADASTLIISGSTLYGGSGGFGGTPFSSEDGGISGDGLRALGGSVVVVRGLLPDTVHAGAYYPEAGSSSGYSALLESSTLIVSGVSLVPGAKLLGGAVLMQPAAEPFLEITGEDAPGSVRTLELRGPAGAPAVLLLGFAEGLVPWPTLESPFWLVPNHAQIILFLVTSGPAMPIALPLQLPASLAGLEGLSLTSQAAFPTVPSTLAPGESVITNPAVVVLRF